MGWFCSNQTLARPSPTRYLPFPFLHNTHPPPFDRPCCLAAQQPSLARTIIEERAHALFHQNTIATLHIRSTAVACPIRRSHACRYLPTIAPTTDEHYLQNDRHASANTLRIVKSAKFALFGKSAGCSNGRGDGRFYSIGRASDRRNDYNVSSRDRWRHV